MYAVFSINVIKGRIYLSIFLEIWQKRNRDLFSIEKGQLKKKPDVTKHYKDFPSIFIVY